jgi:hypothetical protein
MVSTSAAWAVICHADYDPRAPGNVWQLRLSYSQVLAGTRFQIEAPEGFSACSIAPARTIPGVADRKPGLLVSITAFQSSIAANYATIQVIGQLGIR